MKNNYLVNIILVVALLSNKYLSMILEPNYADFAWEKWAEIGVVYLPA